MASTPFSRSSAIPHAAAAYQPAAGSLGVTAHPGTFVSGTKVQVGQHRVVIDRYLSEGGFAHVYVVRVPRDNSKHELAVLKRVAVPDKDALANMRTEVETMKKLKGHRKIVTYIDSHASQLKGGGYEVFLLMEFCSGGGLIDFMNTRLQHRLTEPEILHIFSDVAEGTACMHYLKPPLLHRDLKVENVLISGSNSSKIYKLCDFGSSALPTPAAKNASEGRLIEDDIQRHTTMQYRSPEMVDVYRKQPIDEKADIWALGVLLYKLCYYTTPFEEQGTAAILNASYKFPPYPAFSTKLKQLISWMLKEDPKQRPNIYQVVKESCAMRGIECPIKDIYTGRTQSESRKYDQLPQPPSDMSPPPVVGLQKVAPVQVQQPSVPDITPMRRGRPKVSSHTEQQAQAIKSSSNDPFAALDSKNYDVRSAAVDELASKFPSLDEFSILHEKGSDFKFTSTGPGAAPTQANNANLHKRVTEALADQAFAMPTTTKTGPAAARTQSPAAMSQRIDRITQQPASRSQPTLQEPVPSKSSMVSVGTMTTPGASPKLKAAEPHRPIWRVPLHKPTSRELTPSKSLPNSIPSDLELPPRPETKPSKPTLLERARTKSQTALSIPKSSSSSRPSLEGQRPSMDYLDSSDRSRSANARPRPASVYMESNLDYLKDRESSRTRTTSIPSSKADTPKQVASAVDSSDDDEGPDEHIASDVDFLRSIESTDDSSKKKSRRSSSGGKSKRSSIPSISLSGTKNILAGRFGDAFRRFEGGNSSDAHTNEQDALQPNAPLSPIIGSEKTGTSGRSDDEVLEDSEALSPEVRREIERRRLSQEEKRVAAAAAEYKQRLQQGNKPAPGPSKASSIQSRVKNLLSDTKTTPATRTAEGYGKYTNISKPPADQPKISRKPIGSSDRTTFDRAGFGSIDAVQQRPLSSPRTAYQPSVTPAAQLANRTGPRVAPKPVALRTGGQLPERTTTPNSRQAEDEDWETNFTKKYPSLSGIEMVETEIGPRIGGHGRD
ncbi:hypothetical protein BT63DRAFT_429729 [Microthyrium microscopicum]|uniref:non-specific serine/threonine protein kinase n=1 Tax=Microthyrium microscopicum TaxID=703497 RepID=A0A6A6TVX2_9PEZI|nr:hypothetical protein BT63DRAFT_429729 [Microthyrium microscopicum]